MIEHALSCTAVGSPATVCRWLAGFIARTGADELILASQVFDHRARLRSFEIAADLRHSIELTGSEHTPNP